MRWIEKYSLRCCSPPVYLWKLYLITYFKLLLLLTLTILLTFWNVFSNFLPILCLNHLDFCQFTSFSSSVMVEPLRYCWFTYGFLQIAFYLNNILLVIYFQCFLIFFQSLIIIQQIFCMLILKKLLIKCHIQNFWTSYQDIQFVKKFMLG